ncbi:MAG: metallophosphoesterase [Candidatus Thorarchaeota archaeon]|jgi:hypothetical protein
MAKSKWWDKATEIDGEVTTPRQYIKDHWVMMGDKELASVLTLALGREVSHWMIQSQRYKAHLHKAHAGVPVIFDESKYVKYNDPPKIKGDNVLVLSDVEAPFHDASWCSDLVTLAKHWGIDTVILAGDFLHFSSLSKFTKSMMSSSDNDYEFSEDAEVEISDEVEAAASFGDVLLDNFDRLIMILGNHEKRLTKRLAVATRVNLLRQVLGYRHEKRFEVYPYYFCIVEASSGMWRVSHPANYSVIPVRVASRLADKYQCNYISGHGHDYGETMSVSGFYAAACGCCCDPKRLAYTMLRDSMKPYQQQGAWLLHDSYPYLLHPKYRPVSLFM